PRGFSILVHLRAILFRTLYSFPRFSVGTPCPTLCVLRSWSRFPTCRRHTYSHRQLSEPLEFLEDSPYLIIGAQFYLDTRASFPRSLRSPHAGRRDFGPTVRHSDSFLGPAGAILAHIDYLPNTAKSPRILHTCSSAHKSS